mgnify:CR=1 FL=1
MHFIEVILPLSLAKTFTYRISEAEFHFIKKGLYLYRIHKNGVSQNQNKKEKLYELARKSFFVLKKAEVPQLGDAGSDFIHTNNFVLVDKQLRIRGYYDGTSEKEVNQLISDIKRLQKE